MASRLGRFAALAGAAALALTAAAAADRPADRPGGDERDDADAEATLDGKRIAVLIGEGFHDGETLVPMAYLSNRGADVTVIGVRPAMHEAYNSAITVRVERAVSDVSIDDFDALILPGGRGPQWLREHDEVVEFAGEFFESGRLVAAICHGPQVLVTAGVLEGRKATCIAAISDELTDAGAEYHDVPVKVDDNLITSRIPDDLPAFSQAIEHHLLGKEIEQPETTPRTQQDRTVPAREVP